MFGASRVVISVIFGSTSILALLTFNKENPKVHVHDNCPKNLCPFSYIILQGETFSIPFAIHPCGPASVQTRNLNS